MIAERAAVVLVAAAAAAFLGAGFNAARAEDELFTLGIRAAKPTPADVRQAERLEGRAGRATAGERRVLLLAPVLVRAGDDAAAVRLLEGAVRREPGNAEAWLLLSRAAQRGEPALARRATQRVRELAPPVPEP